MTVLVERSAGVALVTLNRPEQRNAVSAAMRADLARVLDELDTDPDVQVAVLTGAGTAFCAGVDLKEGAAASGAGAALTTPPVVRPLERFTKPVVAAVNGPAVGAGLEIALTADIRVAAETAAFALTEVRIGSLAGSGGIQRLARAVPPSLAARMVFTGEPVDAGTAYAAGLVSELLSPEELLPAALALAERIAANAPLSLRAAKVALRAVLEPAPENLALERSLWAQLSTTADREEGRTAFRERRPPRFKGE
ncbi:MAG: enoyl-CoA hydratase/isomerase family protein [Actinomycetota bacterium]